MKVLMAHMSWVTDMLQSETCTTLQANHFYPSFAVYTMSPNNLTEHDPSSSIWSQVSAKKAFSRIQRSLICSISRRKVDCHRMAIWYKIDQVRGQVAKRNIQFTVSVYSMVIHYTLQQIPVNMPKLRTPSMKFLWYSTVICYRTLLRRCIPSR